MNRSPASPVDLRERVLAAARSERVPTRTQGRRRDALVLAFGFALSLGLSVAVGGPGSRLPPGYTALLTGAWLLVGAMATWKGVARGRSMLGRPAIVRARVAVLTPVALLATATGAALVWPETLLRTPATVAGDLVCVTLTILFALGPLVAFAIVRRRSDPVAPELTGAAIGAASGAWGALAIELHCGHASAAHVLIGHVAPVVLLTLAGGLVGRWVIALRGGSQAEPP